MSDYTFMLGTWQLRWMDLVDHPLFISINYLKNRKQKRFDNQIAPVCIDSGGFTELSRFGKWTSTPQEYVASLHHVMDLGLDITWASQQDWMVEDMILDKTGLSIEDHQQRTVKNLRDLRSLTDRVHFIPVLQGQSLEDYFTHFEMFEVAGFDLRSEPIVGVGSVCRRESTKEIDHIIKCLASKGLNLHGFGMKISGVANNRDHLISSDSMAWSIRARLENARCKDHADSPGAKDCRNCLTYALEWREKVIA